MNYRPARSGKADRQASGVSETLAFLSAAISEKQKLGAYYLCLKEKAPSRRAAEIIESIRRDEVKHYNLLAVIFEDLSGRLIPPSESAPVVTLENYDKGLETAFIGETGNVKTYRKILYAMENRRHFNMMTEIITDEIRHGILCGMLIGDLL